MGGAEKIMGEYICGRTSVEWRGDSKFRLSGKGRGRPETLAVRKTLDKIVKQFDFSPNSGHLRQNKNYLCTPNNFQG